MGKRTEGFPVSEMEARHRARLLAVPMNASCKLCEWTSEGLAGDVLEAQRLHRLGHGFKRSKVARRHVRHLSSFRTPKLTDGDQEDIQREVMRRRRLHGIDEEVAA